MKIKRHFSTAAPAVILTVLAAALVFLSATQSKMIAGKENFKPAWSCDDQSRKIIYRYHIDYVHECKSEKFTESGREAYLVSISLGPGSSCEKGCTYGRFITVLENETDYPLMLLYEKPEGDISSLDNGDLESSFKGRQHWVASTDKFSKSLYAELLKVS